MERVLSNLEMRSADAAAIAAGTDGEALMARAGSALSAVVSEAAERLHADSILFVCGTGNNGGDGYVAARLLSERGLNVRVYALKGKLSQDCEREKSRYKGAYIYDICGAIIVDCIFGTGLKRAVAGETARIIGTINASGAYIISADIPSGLCGDNGLTLGAAVRADLTLAIGEYKLGHFLGDGKDVCGALKRADIGILCPENCAKIYAAEDISKFFPKRLHNSHKGSYGTACLVAGSERYIGAAALAAQAALISGCGYTKLVCERDVKFALAAAMPQAVFTDSVDMNAQAAAIGCGCGVSEELFKTLEYLAQNFRGTLIIDADGLNALASYGCKILKERAYPTVVTPHVKEFSRLTGLKVDEILASPVSAAESFARDFGVTVLLKGATSVITDGENTALNTTGSTALAKAGSGDMLTGYMAGSAARGLRALDAAVCAAYVMGAAAEYAEKAETAYCATAGDILNFVPEVVKEISK